VVVNAMEIMKDNLLDAAQVAVADADGDILACV